MTPPVPYQVSIPVDAVIEALGAFLQPFCSGLQIVRSEVNRVSMPTGPFVRLSEVLQVDLETPIVVNQFSNAQIQVTGPKRIDIQIDFFGPSSGDQCAAVKGVYRTEYTVAQFPAGISPLYCNDGHQMPLTTDQQQYFRRWTLTASLQYDPAIYLPVQFASELEINEVNDIL